MDQITKYYLLCTVRLGTKAHVVEDIPRDKLPALFPKKEVELYLRRLDGVYIARETVVGGGSDGGSGGTGGDSIRTRPPILVIGA